MVYNGSVRKGMNLINLDKNKLRIAFSDPRATIRYVLEDREGVVRFKLINEMGLYLASGKRVLEVGCGGGYFANLLKQASYNVLAGDITEPKTPPNQFWKLQRLKP